MTPKAKKKEIERCLLEFGFLPVTLLLEEYSEEEDYENCALLLEVLQEFNKVHSKDLPTQYGEEAIEYFFKSMDELGYSGDASFRNRKNIRIQLKTD